MNVSDKWLPFDFLNFDDALFQQYNIDTRDFCFIKSHKKTNMQINFAKIHKYPERFYYTAEEAMTYIKRLYTDSGGQAQWRCLYLMGDGSKVSNNWQLKYLRIIRTEMGFVICNNEYYALSKSILRCTVNKELLHAQ